MFVKEKVYQHQLEILKILINLKIFFFNFLRMYKRDLEHNELVGFIPYSISKLTNLEVNVRKFYSVNYKISCWMDSTLTYYQNNLIHKLKIDNKVIH